MASLTRIARATWEHQPSFRHRSAPLAQLLCLNADPVSHPGRPWASRHFTVFLPVNMDPARHTGRPLGSPPALLFPKCGPSLAYWTTVGLTTRPSSSQYGSSPAHWTTVGFFSRPSLPKCGPSLAYWTTVGFFYRSVSLNTDLISHRRRP